MGIDFRRPRHIRGFRLGEVLIFGPGIGRVLVEKTVSGAIANITDGADGVPLKNWLVTLPASLDGYTEVNGYKQGANVIDYASNLTTGTSGGLTFSTTADGGISYSGTASSTFAYVTAKFDFTIKSGQPFTFSRNTAFSYIHRITLTFSDDTTANVSISANDTSVTYTPAKDVKAVRLLVAGLTTNTSYNDTVYLQTEYGSTATAYEAYTAPTTYTASLGRTIYGGTADIVTGEGEDGYSDIVVLNSLNWAKTTISGHSAFYAALPNGYLPTGSSGFDGACDSYEVTQDTTLGTNKTIRFYYNSSYNFSRCIVRDDDYASATAPEFKQAVTGNIVYKLADSAVTPFTFTPITPTPETALGTNNFWADEGDSQVTYYAYAD